MKDLAYFCLYNHQKAAGSMERDENFVPRTRSDYGLPKDQERIVYSDFFEDAPLYTIISLLLMQLGGLQAYLLFNSMGLPSYPPGTNVSTMAVYLNKISRITCN